MKILNLRITISVVLIFISTLISLTSCKDETVEPEIVPGKTSIRLAHSSEISNASQLELFFDGVKVTAQPVAFPEVSEYLPVTDGQKTIMIKTVSGAVLKDTTIAVKEGHQYTVFAKEWLKQNLNEVITIKTAVVTDDNNTTIPEAGKAKVRFVNSLGSNDFVTSSLWVASFLKVNSPNPFLSEEYVTFNLSGASDFVTINAGAIRFKATSLNSVNTAVSVIMPETTIEAGKLYTLYLIGAPGTPSTMQLKLAANN